MKKLLYITPRVDGTGGLQKVLSLKIKYLINYFNFEVVLLTTNAQEDKSFYDFNGITITHLSIKGQGPVYLYNFSKQIKEQIKSINPDIVIVADNGFKGVLVPHFLSSKRTVFYERHISMVEFLIKQDTLLNRINHRIIYKLMPLLARKFTAIVFLNKAMSLEFSSSQKHIIANPLSFTPVLSKEAYPKKVIAVGRHTYQKGFDLLLKVWSEVVKVHPDWVLEIYGDNQGETALEEQAEKMKLTPYVHFFDPVSAIDEKYKQASFLLMTSRYEGFGLVLIEAMANGLPCIAFDCPTGPGEIIEDGSNGYLISDFNLVDYKNKVLHLMENEKSRKEMGENAIKSVDKYHIDTIMKQWDSLFKAYL